jgi:Holliday junction resolvase
VSRGLQRERDLVTRFRDEGMFAMRAPASKGEVDVIVVSGYDDYNNVRRPRVRFFEVKSTKAGPYAGFGPEDRKALLNEAERVGAEAYLCWWPVRKEPEFISSDHWPRKR